MSYNGRLNALWTMDLRDPSQVENFSKLLHGNNQSPILKRLVLILKKKLDALERSETSEEQYTNPSWQALQAHRNGRRQELTNILDLLNFVET